MAFIKTRYEKKFVPGFTVNNLYILLFFPHQIISFQSFQERGIKKIQKHWIITHKMYFYFNQKLDFY
jgi:hypothetical protein